MTTDKHLKPELVKKKYGMGRQLLIYTVLFVVAALGAYSLYIKGHSVFITANPGGNKDGVTQIIPSYIAVKQIVLGALHGEGFSAWNWSIGLGGDNWNMFASKLANPFTYLIIAFPNEKIDLGYTLVSVFRQYCVGLAFMAFGHKVKLSWAQNILGALCYAFSMWMVMTIPDQAGFNTAALLFPLLVLGTEKIIDGESPLIFIISVFYFLTAGVVWGYASGIMIIIYFFLRMIMSGSLKEPKKFFRRFGVFLLGGIVGVMIASFFVSEILMSMSAATTDTGSGKNVWFTMRSYLAAPVSLYKAVGTGANSYSAIGLPIVGVVLMPMFVGKAFRGNCEAIMATVLLIGTQIPAVCRMFNGFSYPSGRWFYMVAFFAAWAAIENFSVETFSSRAKCIIMELWLLITAGWVVLRYTEFDLSNWKTALMGIAGIGLGTAIIVICYIAVVIASSESDNWLSRNSLKIATTLVMLITAANIAEIGFFDTYTHAMDGVRGHAYVAESYAGIMNTSEIAMQEVQQRDSGFYRYDRAGGYYGVRATGTVVNSSIMLGTRPIYTGFSSAPASWHEYNKVVGNGRGSYRRTLVDGNDGRPMLDYLEGVKYFVGKKAEGSEPWNETASLFVPYGYKRAEDASGFEIYQNKYCMGLGTSYSMYITESELMEYPVQIREQVLMQVAVVPDEYADRLGNIKHADKNDIKTEIEEVEFTINDSETAQINRDEKKIYLRDDTGILEISTAAIQDRQVMFVVENIAPIPMDYYEYTEYTTGEDAKEYDQTLKEKIAKSSFKQKEGFKIKTAVPIEVDDRQLVIRKGTKSERGGARGFNDVEDCIINLGYFDEFPGNFSASISNQGIYTYDSIKVYAMPMTIYDENAALLDSRKFEISDWEDDFVEGTMRCEEDSIMYFSILKNKGWHIYVDGKEVEKIKDVNISFTGALLPAGEHRVELIYVYPYKYWLYASTLAGVLLTIGMMIVYLRRRAAKQSEA